MRSSSQCGSRAWAASVRGAGVRVLPDRPNHLAHTRHAGDKVVGHDAQDGSHRGHLCAQRDGKRRSDAKSAAAPHVCAWVMPTRQLCHGVSTRPRLHLYEAIRDAHEEAENDHEAAKPGARQRAANGTDDELPHPLQSHGRGQDGGVLGRCRQLRCEQ